ncbi:4-demethylwyosine synthase TYW1 [archaeon]|nr:MAG: 4-demethylwyosine synthase TYW1 [archaeon]RLG65320.1 MAG: 4-demethylwyosine synthase TYW1 [archaeon]
MIPEEVAKILRKEKYAIVGRHSAVKKCRWLHESLVNNRYCYKQKFYGIKSHRCLQMTPAVIYCTHQCLYCWRVQKGDIGLDWEMPSEWDEPEIIVEESIKAQRQILSGYKVHKKVPYEKYLEAIEPKHAAISLSGEPTLYPYLGELIEEFHRKGMSTFLVTNGTQPQRLAEITQPSQLYISLSAPDIETYKAICRPLSPKLWNRIMESIELIQSFTCPTVVRITAVKGLNMKKPERYAKIILKGNPTYVEVKAYMYVGLSRQRLKFENMPTHEEVKRFATQLAEELSYDIIDESEPSRVVLLSRLKKPIKIGKE